ncbi:MULTISPECIES: bifunctional hydroxymethylpyrimidine kinase/phosphomethylpyrimidine kinase [Dietzia]|jgi:hydroxymethylpyrimidine/phosphomethylpyrimidine kinase|uniref:Hydroxymethylpyrimidine/phosphomethylpyrimidine kinase n=1 Tax=Dietzia cinnamea TaxID=321318 RepID=A0A4R3ZNH9_9ACTN|nr:MULTISPECIES: bifunctional hydroxymethylpyrimidine kinase/phosphomethylpyrimidine kinase [Dietzia]TCW21391.1 hydroxymethylpyrimidine/phosphomethylpyrimidine kinase [Dietzia cinnamea]
MIANVLSIAGTDPSGGAGIQADLKTFSALGVYGMSAITAVVAQNTQGVRRFVALEPAFVADQLAAVFDDVRVDAVKIGMVANAGIALSIAGALDAYPRCPVVLDPVMVAKSGDYLLAPDAVSAVRDLLVPRATILTPNLPEAAVLTGASDAIADVDQMRELLPALRTLGAPWVLLKGGHLPGGTSVDILTGATTVELSAARVDTNSDHGTGCTLSAAIAALVPHNDVVTSVRLAKDYLTGSLQHADELDVGSGHGPVHHFHALWSAPAMRGERR